MALLPDLFPTVGASRAGCRHPPAWFNRASHRRTVPAPDGLSQRRRLGTQNLNLLKTKYFNMTVTHKKYFNMTVTHNFNMTVTHKTGHQ